MKMGRSYFRLARLLIFLAITDYFFAANLSANSQSKSVKALVGGTLVDGYGSKPIRNSVIIIEGERIKAVGQIGSLAFSANFSFVVTHTTARS